MQKVRAFGQGKNNLKIIRKESHEDKLGFTFPFVSWEQCVCFREHSTHMLIKLSNLSCTKFSVRDENE